MMVNASDPQIETVNLFLEAIEDIPHFVVLNKIDMIANKPFEKINELIKSIPCDIVVPASTKEVDGFAGIYGQLQKLPQGKIAILGIFNSGKTSLINVLTGDNAPVDDIPGTTLVITPHEWGDYTLLDTVGQIIDVNKPLMVSIDLSDCANPEAKLIKCLTEDKHGLEKSIPIVIEPLKEAVDLIIKQVEKGGKVITCGAGASALVALEMAGQGQETGLPIMVFTNNFAQIQPVSFAKGYAEDELSLAEYAALAVGPNDVAIGISASGGTGFVFEFMGLAREKGAKTIAITENSDTPMGKNADIIIKSDAKPEGPSSSKIQVAHLAIGHALILTVADMRGIDAHTSIQYMLPNKCRTKLMGIK
jgi:D-arabinose 5-phosphate isomerase GutQ